MPVPFKLVEGKFNHRPEPEFQGIWYPFTGARLKDLYDLKLKDGTILRSWYPNACAWFDRNKVEKSELQRVEDDDVAEIRLMTDTEVDEISWFGFTGESRLKRNLDYFGGLLPDIIRNEDGTVTLKPIMKRVFDDLVRDAATGEFVYWLRVDELSEEELEEAVLNGTTDIEGFYTALDKYVKRSGIVPEDAISLDSGNSIEYLRALFQTAQTKILLDRAEFRKQMEERNITSHIDAGHPKSKKKPNRHRMHVDKGTPVVSWKHPEKKVSNLTGKQRRKLEKKQRREQREQLAKDLEVAAEFCGKDK